MNTWKRGSSVEDCKACGGLLKPATISFGQPLPEKALAEAQRLSLNCDLFLCIGSSLVVYPAARFPELVKEAGARPVIVNRETTTLDSIAHLVIRGQAGDVMFKVLEEVEKS